jgi:sugar phosphate isomerase/epimerase
MKISVTMYSFNQWARQGKIDVKGFIEYCGGIKEVEAVDLLSYYWKDEAKEKPMAVQMLKDKGLALAAFAIGSNFAHADKKVFRDQIDKAKYGVDVTAEMGAPCLRIFGGSIEKADDHHHDPKWGVWGTTLSEDATRAEIMKVVTEAVVELTEYAKDKGVVLAMENHGGIPATAEEMNTMLKDIDSPYFKYCPDTGNFLTSGVDPVTEFKATAKNAVHVHLKDVIKAPPGSTREYAMCTIGEGIVDIAGCIKVMQDVGYDKYLSIEYEGMEDPKEGVKKSVEYTQSVLESL